jgi:septum formation protein
MTTIPYNVILASKSPRRQELIKGLELPFEIRTYDVDESFPGTLKAHEIAVYLAEKKAQAYPLPVPQGSVLLTADTIVWVNGHVLNKPENADEAFAMLKEICGTVHEVFTGVSLRTADKIHTFYDRTEVTCKAIPDEAIRHYINHYKPFDKAGSYGIQDWFGYTAVEKVNGCFYNVMGLPVSKLYGELQRL